MVHGAARPPSVDVLSYSLELRGGEEGFLGDRPTKGRFALGNASFANRDDVL